MKGLFLFIITITVLLGTPTLIKWKVDYDLEASDRKIYNEEVQLSLAIQESLKLQGINVPLPILIHWRNPEEKFVKQYIKDNPGLNTRNIGVWLGYPSFQGWEHNQILNFIKFYKEEHP